MTPSIRFVNFPPARSSRIPEGKWEEYRSEICGLYLTMTVHALVKTMRYRYGFEASEKQYIYRLGKWGVTKYNSARGTGQPLNEVQQPVPTPPLQADLSGETVIEGKRTRNIADLDSSKSLVGCPLEKKRKAASASDDNFAASENGDSTSTFPASAATGGVVSTVLSSLSVGSRAILDDNIHIEPLEKTMENDEATTIYPFPIDEALRLRQPICRPEGPETACDRDATYPLQAKILDRQLSFAEIRKIYRNRPVNALSEDEVETLKRAADYLTIIHDHTEAFELYAMLLKWHQSESKTPCRYISYRHLVIQCVYTAKQPQHVEIVRHILLNELRKHQKHEAPEADQQLRFCLFMVHAFLELVLRAHSHKEGTIHFNCAQNYLPAAYSSMLDVLPNDDRSLDLPFLLNVFRVTSCPDLVPKLHVRALDESARDLEQLFLRRVPGPFEVHGDGFHSRMSNPCIRSCLDWCEHQIRVAKSKAVILPKGPKSGTSPESLYSAIYRLFTVLWKSWNASSLQEEVWMTQTEKRMGISSGELLFVICKCIHWPHIGKRRNLLDPVRTLQALPDDLLAARVYKLYLTGTSVYIRGLQEPTTSSRLDPILETLAGSDNFIFLRVANPNLDPGVMPYRRASPMQSTDVLESTSLDTTLPFHKEDVFSPVVPGDLGPTSLVSSLETAPSMSSFKRAEKATIRHPNHHPEQDSASNLDHGLTSHLHPSPIQSTGVLVELKPWESRTYSDTTLPFLMEDVFSPIVPRNFDCVSLVSSLETTPSLRSFKRAGKAIERRLHRPKRDSASSLNRTVSSVGAVSISDVSDLSIRFGETMSLSSG